MKHAVEVQADDKIAHGSRQCFSFLHSEAGGFYLFIESVSEQWLEGEMRNLTLHKPFLHLLFSARASALEAAASLGGEDLVPFYSLLEGGREGEFFRELEDYFYYVQLRSQGIDALETRQVSTHIPLEEIPSVMRAMGFYPSEEEIEEMINEVKFSEYVDTGEQVTKINLGDFIKLYINHRPAFGLSMKAIRRAFQVLGYDNENGDKVIDRGDLLLLLQCRGEHMTEDELAQCLAALLGRHSAGGRFDLDTCDPSGAAALTEEEIPEEITAKRFTADILGLPIAEPEKRTVKINEQLICEESEL
uniref:Cilia and flagella associated protein 251 n=1 Tax=Cairina moschata TaxID=8855 RepID=A0A8C3BSS4_CAIMO